MQSLSRYFAPGGDLSAALKQQKGLLAEETVLDWFAQMCLGLKHIHDRKIVHRLSLYVHHCCRPSLMKEFRLSSRC